MIDYCSHHAVLSIIFKKYFFGRQGSNCNSCVYRCISNFREETLVFQCDQRLLGTRGYFGVVAPLINKILLQFSETTNTWQCIKKKKDHCDSKNVKPFSSASCITAFSNSSYFFKLYLLGSRTYARAWFCLQQHAKSRRGWGIRAVI